MFSTNGPITARLWMDPSSGRNSLAFQPTPPHIMVVRLSGPPWSLSMFRMVAPHPSPSTTACPASTLCGVTKGCSEAPSIGTSWGRPTILSFLSKCTVNRNIESWVGTQLKVSTRARLAS